MPEMLIKMATEQSFSVALLLLIAYVLWKTFRADMVKKDLKYDFLEKQFHELQNEFRTCIQSKQEEALKLLAHTTEVLERNTAILEKLAPLVQNTLR